MGEEEQPNVQYSQQQQPPRRQRVDPLAALPTLTLDLASRVTRVETQNDWILAGLGRADESRKELHEKLERVGRAVDIIEEMRPIVHRLEQERIKLSGAYWAGGIASKIGWTIIVGVASMIGFLFDHVISGKWR